jgi:hypothetical protein
VRHSNTRIVLRDQATNDEVEITLDSSYQRDLFSLVFAQMNKQFTEHHSKIELSEIDFFKRREKFLESQMTQLIKAHKDEVHKLTTSN